MDVPAKPLAVPFAEAAAAATVGTDIVYPGDKDKMHNEIATKEKVHQLLSNCQHLSQSIARSF